jgi:protein-tyrosine phosphatase
VADLVPDFRILFVCLGNICRSPTAEGVMRSLVAERGLERRIELESAGTGAWHVGHPPDERAASAASARGIALDGVARRVEPADFERFDLLIAMDRDNLAELRRMADGPGHESKLALLREFDPAISPEDEPDVPDPYYGGEAGFERVLDLVDDACRGLLDHVVRDRI